VRSGPPRPECAEEKRLELAARGAVAKFETLRALDFGRCRSSLAVPMA